MASPPSTPKTSRPLLGRILRSYTKNRRTNEEKEEQKITGFFHIRKRMSPTYGDKPEVLRKRRGVIITDAHALTPAEPYPKDSPLPTHLTQLDDVDCGPSPPKRPRELTPLGVFDVLGEYERFDFLAALPISFYIKLALTSSEWAQNITYYLSTNTWKRRFVTSVNNYQQSSTEEDPFTTTGQLFKAITISKQTDDRIKIAIPFVESVYNDVKHARGWFRFFYSFSYRWATREKIRLFKAMKVMHDGKVDNLIKASLSCRHGQNPQKEMELRNLIHAHFVHPLLDDSSTAHKREAGFWLSCLMKGIHNVGMQGRFCMIVFAPLTVVNGEELIHWRTLVDDVVISMEDAQTRLAPLAIGLSALISVKEEEKYGLNWKQDDIFNMIEEITTFPDPWSFDNFVAFLMQHTSLLPIAVCTRIHHNHREEAGQIVNTMKTLMFRWGMDTTAALGRPLRYILSALNNKFKESFVMAILDAHQSQCREYILLGDAARSGYEEEVLAQLAFSTLFSEALNQIQ